MYNAPRPMTLRTLREENTRLKDDNQDLREELSRLQHAVHALGSIHRSLESINPATDVYALVRELLTSVLAAVDSQDGSLLLLDEEKQELVFVEVQGSSRDALLGYRLPTSEGIAGWVVTHRTPELVPDVHQDSRFSPLVDQTTGFRTCSVLCVPLVSGDRSLGAIEVVNTRSGEPFTEKDLDVLLLISGMATLVLIQAERLSSAVT